jgi:CHAT domain-containing protein
VLSPLLPGIGDRDLIVIPDGRLAQTPWAALPGCAGWPVTVTPSVTSWLAATRRLAAARERDPGWLAAEAAAVLVAGPGNARGDAEIRAIAALRPHASVLTGADATPAAALAAFGRAGLAHLAAHGQHQAENELFYSLELAGAPLLGYDLQQAARAPLMVVLSSCDLGLTDVRPGDETFGMVTALLSAGSATVVASVARVADDTAMATMTGYHRAIAAGISPAAALAGALDGETSACLCLGRGPPSQPRTSPGVGARAGSSHAWRGQLTGSVDLPPVKVHVRDRRTVHPGPPRAVGAWWILHTNST